MTLWEILKANKTGIAPDMFTMLAASKMNGGRDRLHELSGTPPLSFTAKGKPLTAWSITGNTVQDGTPTPENPVEVFGCGDYDSDTGMYRIPVVTSADGTEPITTPIYLPTPLHKIGDYADSVSYAEQKAERVVKELVLTGEENFSYDDTYTRFTLKIPNARATSNRSDETPCTHYISIHDGRSIYDVPDDSIYVTVGGGYVYINIKDITYTSLADFKSYLAAQYAAGTPVKVYYVMQTPETKTVEPVEIPTLNGTTVIDVDTAVKPESMTVKYRR